MSVDDSNSTIVYVTGLSLVLIGSLMLACFCSELAPDYTYTTGLRQVTCSISNSTIIGNVCCQADVTSISNCGEKYIYPCAIVTFSTDDTENGTLFKDYKSAVRKSSIGACSFYHCQQDSYDDRLQEVNEFTSTYSTGSEHTCHYGYKEHHNGNVAVISKIDSAGFIMAIFISCILLTAGIIVLTIMCLVEKLRNKSRDDNVERLINSSSSHDLKENMSHENENHRGNSTAHRKEDVEIEDTDNESDITTVKTNVTTVSVRSSISKSNGGMTPYEQSPEHHPHHTGQV